MQAESILMFVFDLLDYSKSPQAEAFNMLFNNIDVYYVFKMQLPTFISNNSPHKMKAMKLLHQYILNKPIVDEESKSLFFSTDASKNNVSFDLQDAFDQFIRYHKRQLNSQDFGIGTNAAQYKKSNQNVIGHEIAASNYESDNFRRQLRSSFMYSNMRKPSMSQNDPDETNYISLEHVLFNNSEECKKNNDHDESDSPKVLLSDTSERFEDNFTKASNNQAKSPQFFLKEGSPFKEKPQEKKEEIETDDYFQKKKIIYSQQKNINEQRNFLKMNFYIYQKEWLDNLKEMNKQFELSKKELITLNRFDYKIHDIKKLLYTVKVNENTSIPIYQSDFSIDTAKKALNQS